uniref:EF-hand and coiled-coil domain containing 1 n=1 Tax=Gasterosteus aculeatus TaxID=69293 RepID=G3PA49_GASAC
LAPQRVQPWPRAARKSEWLRSALAHHHGPDPCADNEIVVLATGVDQYLQEVFHHLAHPSQEDSVSAEDFTALCAVLGLAAAEKAHGTTKGGDAGGAKGEDDEEFGDACSALPCRLSFKDFHSRLCGYFRVRSARERATGAGAVRLPVTEDTELVERQIRLRWPRVRRRKCTNTMSYSRPDMHKPDEVAALRELVEDLRSALQGSDARCLALEVALRRERSRAPPPRTSFQRPAPSPTTSIALARGRSGGDLSTRRRAEEAREALSLGLQRVRMMQEEAQSVPQLQCKITQLEAELHQYR